jgi:hypothetical protein
MKGVDVEVDKSTSCILKLPGIIIAPGAGVMMMLPDGGIAFVVRNDMVCVVVALGADIEIVSLALTRAAA